MNNKISLLILSITLSLTACQKSNDSIENPSKTENQNTDVSNVKSQNTAIDTTINCSNATLDQWYGFDEAQLEDAKCVQLNNSHIKKLKCEKVPNAFGADFDGIRFESKDERIFAYHSKELCDNAKEIWESNAP